MGARVRARIRRTRWVRVHADVLLIAPGHVFSLEFNMKEKVDPAEVAHAARYVPCLEMVMGSDTNVVPVLVLTRACDLFVHGLLDGNGKLPVASGDMLFTVFDECLWFPEW